MVFRLEFPCLGRRKDYPDNWDQKELINVAKQLILDPRITQDPSRALAVLSSRSTDGTYEIQLGITKGRILPVYDVRFWKWYLPIVINQENYDWVPSLLKQVRTWNHSIEHLEEELDTLLAESSVVGVYGGKETLNFSSALGKVSGDLTQALAIEHAETVTTFKNKITRRRANYAWIKRIVDAALETLSDEHLSLVEATYFGPAMDCGLVAALLQLSAQAYYNEHDQAIRTFAASARKWVQENYAWS